MEHRATLETKQVRHRQWDGIQVSPVYRFKCSCGKATVWCSTLAAARRVRDAHALNGQFSL